MFIPSGLEQAGDFIDDLGGDVNDAPAAGRRQPRRRRPTTPTQQRSNPMPDQANRIIPSYMAANAAFLGNMDNSQRLAGMAQGVNNLLQRENDSRVAQAREMRRMQQEREMAMMQHQALLARLQHERQLAEMKMKNDARAQRIAGDRAAGIMWSTRWDR